MPQKKSKYSMEPNSGDLREVRNKLNRSLESILQGALIFLYSTQAFSKTKTDISK